MALIDLVDVFKHFDPLHGTFYGQARLNDIARRARRHLARGRSLDELRNGVGDIQTIIAWQTESLEEEREQHVQRRVDELRDLILDVEWKVNEGETFYAPDEYFEYRKLFSANDYRLEFDGDATALGFPPIDEEYTDLELFNTAFDVDDSEWREMKNATEHEMFALFSLWKLDEAARLLRLRQLAVTNTDAGGTELVETKIPVGSEHHLWRLSVVMDLAVEAMDAVCTSEHIESVNSHRAAVAATVKTTLSDRARQAARQNKKHQEVKQLKAELSDWYMANYEEFKNSSNEKVAELGMKVVPLPFRTVRDTIAALKKAVQKAS